MTLILELPEEDLAEITARAVAQGLSAQQYVQQVVKRAIERDRPLAARIREIWGDVPDEVRSRQPSDGASQIDHYVYGLPKRDP